ncbi:hypothetical protein ACOKM3_14170 [Streptomyces sp. BH106]|uniref:hypothetical protein n=1 Tax=Streptomyces sp. BH106 TaxID=3410409 RepID=UPI003CEE0A44
MNHRPPIADPNGAYAEVMRRAGWSCQCGGSITCGGRHAYGCCDTSAEYRKPLIALPRDPDTPAHEAVTLGPDDLVALCRACATRRTKTHKQEREKQRAEQAAESALFEL